MLKPSAMDVKLSIITVNYNGLNDTLELLQSLYSHVAGFVYEVIVVDNGSAVDESIEIKETYPQTLTIRSEQNLGFAGGNNLGIVSAKGTYLLLINNDTFVTDNGLSNLLKVIEQDDTITVVSPKICFAFGEKRIQFAGYTPLSNITLRNNLIGYNELDAPTYNESRITPYAHGAAMLLRRSVLDMIGPMPEIYFLYYEEIEWCERIVKAGGKIMYEPSCVVFHKESASTGQNSPLRTYYLVRNRLLFAYRNRRGSERILSLLYQLVFVFPSKLFTYILKGKTKYVLAEFRALLDFIKMGKH